MPDLNQPTHLKPTSPGDNCAPIEGRTSLRELTLCGKINIRGAADDAQFLNAVGATLGMPLPLDANTTSVGSNGIAFWLGPDEWLLHCAIARTENLMTQLTPQLAPFHHAVTEVSDYYRVLEVRGENAGAVLARGCPLDLHERAFKATHCAQTRFGNASILLHKPDAEPSFHLQVRWSFTGYVWDYLAAVIATL